jgi:hypothetical protein
MQIAGGDWGTPSFVRTSGRPSRWGPPSGLVIVKTTDVGRVEAGEDASKIKKKFFIREDLKSLNGTGRVTLSVSRRGSIEVKARSSDVPDQIRYSP